MEIDKAKPSDSTNRILYLARHDVQAICMDVDAVAIMRKVFFLHGSGETIVPDEAYLGWRTPGGSPVRSLNMPGYLGGDLRIAGTKIINSNLDNPSQGLARAAGITLLFDPETVRIRCILEGSYISAVRTAAVSVLALTLLAGPLESMAVIGTGTIGRAHLEMVTRMLPSVRRIVLCDKNMENAMAAAAIASTSAGRPIEVQCTSQPAKAVEDADILLLATTTTEGYVQYGWLKPGVVVLNVSLDDLLPEVFLKTDLLFVDDWNLIRADNHRRLGKMSRDGAVVGPRETSTQARRVDAEIGDLVVGKHGGRKTHRDIIVVNPFGLAIEDVALASRVFEIASQRGLGTYLSL